MKIDLSKVRESIRKIHSMMLLADVREQNKKANLPEDDSIEGMINKLENLKGMAKDVQLADNLVEEAEVLKSEFCKSIDDAFYIEKEDEKEERNYSEDLLNGLHFLTVALLLALGMDYVESKFFDIPTLVYLIPALMALGGIFSSSIAFAFCLANYLRKDKLGDYQMPFYKRIYIGILAIVLAVSLWTAVEDFPQFVKEYFGF